MPIERKNSFHLMLSDDELELLRLLAERDGLNASDYLRTLLRRMAGTPPYLAVALRARELLPHFEDELTRKKPPKASGGRGRR